jgi:2'-5' RNA ligase
MTRVFIALELNESLQRFLGEIITGAARELPGLRWANPAGIHLTLAFLGEIDDELLALAEVGARAAAAQVRPFSYRLSGLGVFGSTQQPRVVWMGVEEPTGRMSRLHSLLARELVRRSFEVDTRPFSPHLTLARVKHAFSPAEERHLQRLLASTPASPESYRVGVLHVMKSELLRGGAKYTPLAEIPLKKEEGERQ